jgi:CDGSH-type Zn-finger protein
MSESEEPQKKPCFIKLKGNQDYYWCACGQSKKQPFCDGSHEGTEHTPLKINFEEDGFYNLCGCKKTKRPPYCDGSHRD